MKHDHKTGGCAACATGSSEEKEPFWRRKAIRIMVIAGMLFALGLALEFLTGWHLQAQILFFAVVIVSGYNIVKQGLLSLWKRRLDMTFLITLEQALS